MTEREKNEICKGYADLIIRKEQLIREIWKTEFGIRNLEDILEQYKEYVDAVKYWQTIKKYDGKRKK